MAEGPIDYGILAGAGAPVKEFKTGDIKFPQGDAATDVRLVAVGEKQFLFMVSQTPHFALNVMRTLVRRLRAQNNAI